MDNSYVNIRFGMWHFMWSPEEFGFKKNYHHSKEFRDSNWKKFEVYKFLW